MQAIADVHEKDDISWTMVVCGGSRNGKKITPMYTKAFFSTGIARVSLAMVVSFSHETVLD